MAVVYLVRVGTSSVMIKTETDFESKPKKLLLDFMVVEIIIKLGFTASSS